MSLLGYVTEDCMGVLSRYLIHGVSLHLSAPTPSRGTKVQFPTGLISSGWVGGRVGKKMGRDASP